MDSPPVTVVNQITFYVNVIIFVIAFVAEAYVLSKRRFKLDPSALITLSLYFTVMFLRFLRCFINENGVGIDVTDDTPLQTGISLSCHTLISMTLYYFVYEMQLVRYQSEFCTKS
jgi:hypothetical protein